MKIHFLSIFIVELMLLFFFTANAQNLQQNKALKSDFVILNIQWLGKENSVVKIGRELTTVLEPRVTKQMNVRTGEDMLVRLEKVDSIYVFSKKVKFTNDAREYFMYIWMGNAGNLRVKLQTAEEKQIETEKRTQALSELETNMITIQGGGFRMGCSKEQQICEPDENPSREVRLNDFKLNRYEVTQKQWFAIMTEEYEELGDYNCEDCPIFNVSWYDVELFLTRLNQKTGRNFRLPTEAEWEYASKGGRFSRGLIYSGHSTIGEVGWYIVNGSKKVNPVGMKKPNELGLYDMTGNVYEWCYDWYDIYNFKDINNPTGSHNGKTKVIRGGSWMSIPRFCRNSSREKTFPENRNSNIGFRIAE